MIYLVLLRGDQMEVRGPSDPKEVEEFLIAGKFMMSGDVAVRATKSGLVRAYPSKKIPEEFIGTIKPL